MSEAPVKFEHAADDEPRFGAIHDLKGKRIDPKEWASHILHINIACEVLAQDPAVFEKRVRETMSPDGSEWVEEIDSLTSSHEYLTAVASVLNSANARILLALGRIAGVDQDEDADQAGPDNNAPKGKPSARRAHAGHATTGRSGMSSGGAPWIELEGMICDGVREANCLRAICETGHFDEFEEGLQYLANNLTVSLREISRMYYELHGLVHGSGD